MQNTKLNAAYRLQTVTLYGHMDFHSQATSADGKKASTNGQVQLLKKKIKSGTLLYSAFYMRRTCGQKRFYNLRRGS